jgi:deoxyribodipyrimidine photo-lyase
MEGKLTSIETLLSDPRVQARKSGPPDPEGTCVVYWMQRAQRGFDNPALDVAIEAANLLRKPIAVFFGLHPGYPNANLRHYTFLIEGIAGIKEAVEKRGACFVFRPFPNHNLIRFCEEVRPSLIVGDENPMRQPEAWRRSAAAKLRVPLWTVDADVIVPSRIFPKEEFAARTLRPKLHRLLPAFLTPLKNPKAAVRWETGRAPETEALDEKELLARLPLDRSAQAVSHYKGGSTVGKKLLKAFLSKGLDRYDADRNQPQLPGLSSMSAYLHYGHLGPHTIALAVRDADAPQAAKDAFLEELIVRRELAINFVLRNPNYDRLEGCNEWGLKTLREHEQDEREHTYTLEEFESAETHDPLWNAAQLEMVVSGKMHGYMRMYWAKKILEWTRTPEEAFDAAVILNDRYELDGRDPNGYTGIAWAIGGKHDRPWPPARPVFGLIRFMNANGCARKFDVKAYIRKIELLSGRAIADASGSGNQPNLFGT